MDKIYIAGAYGSIAECKKQAEIIRGMGYQVVSTWHDQPIQNEEDLKHGIRVFVASVCLAQIDKCDMFIYFSSDDTTHGGRDVELGYVIGKKKVVLVGPITNIFTSLYPGYDTWEELIRWEL